MAQQCRRRPNSVPSRLPLLRAVSWNRLEVCAAEL